MPSSTVCQGFNPGAGTLSYTPVAVFVDSTGPTLSPSGGQVSGADATASFAWSTNEPLTSAECRVDAAAYAPCSTSSSHTVTAAEGAHTFSVRGTDLSGNLGSAASTSFRIIETTLVSGPADVSNQASPTFVFASGQGTAFDCSVDGVLLSDCGLKDGANHGTKSFTGLADGSHTFRVRAKDGPDKDPSTLVRTWTIDTDAPTTTLDPTTGPGEGALQAVTTETFAFTSEEGATFQCRLDSAAYAACTSPKTVSGLKPGAHHFDVRAIDAAGNTGPAAVRSWQVSKVVVPPPAALKLTARAAKRSTRITTMTVTGLGKAGATVVLRCQGRGCPPKLKGRGVTTTTRAGSLALKQRVRMALKPGTKLVITARVPGRTTTFTVKIRAGSKPVVTRR
jgi:large repetitive protein